MSYKFPVPCKKCGSQLVERGPSKHTVVAIETANKAVHTGMNLQIWKGGTSEEDQREAWDAADFVVKALNLHDLLVAVVECSQALDMQVDEGRTTLVRYGWDYSNRDDLNARQFVWNLRKKAIAKLREQT